MARASTERRLLQLAIVCLAANVAAVNTAAAQDASPLSPPAASSEPDPASVRLRIGPLLLNPTLSLTNAGVDDNVFNDPTSAGPKRDFTMTVTPRTDLWMRVGASWLSGYVKEDINWYQQNASERSANTTYGLGWRVPLSRLVATLNTTFIDSHDRPGFEIDARAHRRQVGIGGGVEYHALSRTFLGATATRDVIAFDPNATFLGTNLHDELSRVASTYGVTVREQITDLTSITFTGTHAQDRFEFAPVRDTDTNAATVGVVFDPQALIRGSASIGYADFKPQDPALPGYRGITANVGLSYTLLDMTKVAFNADRSVQYWFDLAQPYYVLTGYTGSLAQQIFGPVDVVLRGGRESLAYRDLAGVPVGAPNRSDEVTTYGGGIGYHLGKTVRLGFNVDHAERSSPIDARTYRGLRYGTALTYGM